MDLTDQQAFHRQHILTRQDDGSYLTKAETQWVAGEVIGIEGDMKPMLSNSLEEIKARSKRD